MTHQYCTLYRARNLVNGKEYYGIAVDPKRRWSRHKRSAFSNNPAEGFALARAIKKHGADAFEFSVLMEERGDDAVTKCKDAEMLVIAMANSQVPNGYNITAGGDGGNGIKHSDEYKASRSLWAIEHWNKPEVKAIKEAAIKRHWGDQANREKQSAWATEYWNRPEIKLAQSIKAKEAQRRPSTKLAAQAYWDTPGAREAHSLKTTEINARPEVRKAKSIASKEHWNRPEVKAAQSARQKDIQNRPEIKAARAERMKKGLPWDKAREATKKAVMCVELNKIFDSMHDAVRWLKLNGSPKACVSAISNAASGKAKSAYGHTWKFMEKETV